VTAYRAPEGARAQVDSWSASEEARSRPSTSDLDPSVSLSRRSGSRDLRRDRTWRRLRGDRSFARTGLCEDNNSLGATSGEASNDHPSVVTDPDSERESGRSGKGPGLEALGKPARLVVAFRRPVGRPRSEGFRNPSGQLAVFRRRPKPTFPLACGSSEDEGQAARQSLPALGSAPGNRL